MKTLVGNLLTCTDGAMAFFTRGMPVQHGNEAG